MFLNQVTTEYPSYRLIPHLPSDQSWWAQSCLAVCWQCSVCSVAARQQTLSWQHPRLPMLACPRAWYPLRLMRGFSHTLPVTTWSYRLLLPKDTIARTVTASNANSEYLHWTIGDRKRNKPLASFRWFAIRWADACTSESPRAVQTRRNQKPEVCRLLPAHVSSWLCYRIATTVIQDIGTTVTCNHSNNDAGHGRGSEGSWLT